MAEQERHFVVAHTLPQFKLFQNRGLLPEGATYIPNAMRLRGVRNATVHKLPDWHRGYRMSDCLDIDYMIREGFFEEVEHGEPDL